MNSFVSWSGGKDCTIALHLWLERHRAEGGEVCKLLHMRRPEEKESPSHFIATDLLEKQSQSLQIPIHIEYVSSQEKYETAFRRVLSAFRNQGIEEGIFGDIYLEAHRTWLEKMCQLEGIRPSFPLWGKTSEEVMQIFLSRKYTSIITSIKRTLGFREILGTPIDDLFLRRLQSFPEKIDVCGENGEFHSFVTDAPLFAFPLEIDFDERKNDDKYDYIQIRSKQ